MPEPDYSLPPIRTGAAPTLDVTAAGLELNRTWQPGWVRMTPVLVKWIRYHFSLATRIEHPDLVGRVWTDQPSTPIFISSLAEWAPNTAGQRPCVLVDRLDQVKDTSKRGIGDQLMGIKPGKFAHFMQGRHVVHCLGGREGETDLLAWEVWRELTRFAPVLRERLCLTQLIITGIGKRIQLTAETKEHYTVPIEMSYAYQESWIVNPLDEEEITAINTMFAE